MSRTARTTFSVRIDAEVKDEFDDFCREVGINASMAFNMFIRAVLREKRLPFDVTTESNNFRNENGIAVHGNGKQARAGVPNA